MVTASTGNHGAATAWAAAREGMRAVVYVPEGASASKLAMLDCAGRRAGSSTATTWTRPSCAATAYATANGLPFFEDGAEPAQFAGYAAIAGRDRHGRGWSPGAVLVSVGNGALLIGIGSRLAEISPSTRRIGIVAREAPVMAESFAARKGWSSPTAVRRLPMGWRCEWRSRCAVDELGHAADEMIEVSEREIAQAVGAFAGYPGCGWRDVLRPRLAGARSIADRLPESVVIVVTGANIDEDLWRRAVDKPDSFPA